MKPKTLTQNAKEAKIIPTDKGNRLICRIRKSKLVIGREERFRQRLLNYLIDDLGYDEENIKVEVPLTHHKKGESGRADIVVYDKPHNENGAKPLMVIECKDPENENQAIEEYGIEQQILKYTSILNPTLQFITNDYFTLGKDLRNENLIEDYIPSLVQIKNNKIKYTKPEKYIHRRCPINLRNHPVMYEGFVDNGYISSSTRKELAPYIIQLFDFFNDDKSSFDSMKLSVKFILKEDLGLKVSSYGYAGSGGLIGEYRRLLIEYPKGNSKIIGYSIYRQGLRGTYLSISVDNRKGLALELQLDKFIVPNGKTEYQIIHNGVMAIGHKGSMKAAVVLEYVGKKAPFLLENGKVLLGTFKLNKHLKFQQKEVQDFIFRTSTYAILRDELRKES